MLLQGASGRNLSTAPMFWFFFPFICLCRAVQMSARREVGSESIAGLTEAAGGGVRRGSLQSQQGAVASHRGRRFW